MVYGLWQSAAGMQAQQYRQAVVANNLANAETPGFKADRIAFRERLSASMAGGETRARHPVLSAMTGGLFEAPVHTDFAQGSIITSNNPLDVAIDGDGFLTVMTSDGPRYSRDGRLMMNKDGMLVQVSSGGAIIDADRQPIILDRTSTEGVKVDAQGYVRQGESVVGRLALVDFTDRRNLEKIGHDLYDANGARPIESQGRFRQFAIEASGVEPVTALVEMIAATRAYELNARMVSLQDESLGRMVNELGRIG